MCIRLNLTKINCFRQKKWLTAVSLDPFLSFLSTMPRISIHTLVLYHTILYIQYFNLKFK